MRLGPEFYYLRIRPYHQHLFLPIFFNAIAVGLALYIVTHHHDQMQPSSAEAPRASADMPK